MSLKRDAFTLPKVNPKSVYQQLLAGKYDSFGLDDIRFDIVDNFKKKIIEPKITADTPGYEESVNSKGKKMTLMKANHEKYQRFIDLSGVDEEYDYTCLWCRRQCNTCDHGYPVQLPFKIDKIMNTMFVHVIYTSCTFNCALAEIMNRIERFPDDQQYEEALLLLKYLFHLQYPGKKVEPSPDYLLRKENGGPLSDDIYFNNQYTFKELPNHRTVPTQKLYFFSKSK